MNKANQRELDKALSLLAIGDNSLTEIACRTLATIQRCGTAADSKTVLSVIKDKGLSAYFYTDNNCLVVHADNRCLHS